MEHLLGDTLVDNDRDQSDRLGHDVAPARKVVVPQVGIGVDVHLADGQPLRRSDRGRSPHHLSNVRASPGRWRTSVTWDIIGPGVWNSERWNRSRRTPAGPRPGMPLKWRDDGPVAR